MHNAAFLTPVNPRSSSSRRVQVHHTGPCLAPSDAAPSGVWSSGGFVLPPSKHCPSDLAASPRYVCTAHVATRCDPGLRQRPPLGYQRRAERNRRPSPHPRASSPVPGPSRETAATAVQQCSSNSLRTGRTLGTESQFSYLSNRVISGLADHSKDLGAAPPRSWGSCNPSWGWQSANLWLVQAPGQTEQCMWDVIVMAAIPVAVMETGRRCMAARLWRRGDQGEPSLDAGVELAERGARRAVMDF
jgi:hypothetical protein